MIEPGIFASIGSGSEATDTGGWPMQDSHALGLRQPMLQPRRQQYAATHSHGMGCFPAHAREPVLAQPHSRSGESSEPLPAPRHQHWDPEVQQLRGLASMTIDDDSGDEAEPSNFRSAPAQREIAVQTNRESILRHHRENCDDRSVLSEEGAGGDDARRDISDALEAATCGQRLASMHGAPGERQAHDEPPAVLSVGSGISGTTGHSAFTGRDNMSCLNTGRSVVLQDLAYPRASKFSLSAISEQVLTKAASKAAATPSACRRMMGEALDCSLMDEITNLDSAWGIADGSSGRVDRVATYLKKVARKAVNTCINKSHKVEQLPGGEEPASLLQQRCDELQKQLADSDRRSESLKQLLRSPAPALQQLTVLSELCGRLGRSDDSSVIDTADFEAAADAEMQGLLGANAACLKMNSQYLELLEAERKRNSEFALDAQADCVPGGGTGGGAMAALSSMP